MQMYDGSCFFSRSKRIFQKKRSKITGASCFEALFQFLMYG